MSSVMYSGRPGSARNTRTSWSQITFRLPDVSLLHSVSSKGRSSDTVVYAGRLIHVNVVGVVLDANHKVVQVWSGTCEGDWTVETLKISSINVCFLQSPTREERTYLGHRFVLHFKATNTLETGVEHCRNVHGFRCREFDRT